MKDYTNLSSKYNEFIYHSYDFCENEDFLKVEYYFEIVGLDSFRPQLFFPLKNKNSKISLDHPVLKRMIFCLGMIELISYWKLTAAPKLTIKASRLNEAEIEFFKTVYYEGLKEYFYLNKIVVPKESFLTINCLTRENSPFLETIGCACCRHLPDAMDKALLPLGGGKDSLLSLEILKQAQIEFIPFAVNPNDSIKTSLNNDKRSIESKSHSKLIPSFVKRNLDPKLLSYNQAGFLNGHTPFSALLAFISLIQAYIHNYKWIVLSNEQSANESTVHGKDVNHQWSKSVQFERMFQSFITQQLGIEQHYFSLLRPLSELKIASLFANFKDHLEYFKSCNVGSKKSEWCEKCAKCLFVYLIVGCFCEVDELAEKGIFTHNLLADITLLPILEELLGMTEHKPFECVGEVKEVILALELLLKKYEAKNIAIEKMPALLQVYAKKLRSNLPLLQNKDELNQIFLPNEEYIFKLPAKFQKILLDFLQKYQ